MTKVIIHFVPEGMNIVFLLKYLKGKNSVGGNISHYLKDKNFQINYYEYQLISKLHPMVFEKYTFSFHSHGSKYCHYFSQGVFVDSLLQFSSIYAFHRNINQKTRHSLMWNETWINGLMKLLKNKDCFDLNRVLDGFFAYRKEIGHVPLGVYDYLNTLFLIHLSESYEIFNFESNIILRLNFSPKGCAGQKKKEGRKFIYRDISLREVAHFLNLIEEKSFDSLIFITKNRQKVNRKIDFFKSYFLANGKTGITTKIYEPFDPIDLKLSKNSLFMVFDDSKSFFESLSFFRNYGILCSIESSEDR